MKVCIK